MADVNIKVEKLDYASNEAYRALRTNLKFCGEDKKAIVLTSCTPNEGKSTVSLYLAMSLAESGKRVLLVDTDMRKSVLAGNFTANKEVMGLSHFLSGQSYLKNVICSTSTDNLDIIFAGPTPPNPAELLESLFFQVLLRYGRDNYDYVLVDSPPLGSVIDSAIVAKKCDGALIIIEAEAISYRFVKEVKSQLEKSSCPILGAVLNKVDLKEHRYYDYYYGRKRGDYYGRYYGYGSYGHEEEAGRKGRRRKNK